MSTCPNICDDVCVCFYLDTVFETYQEQQLLVNRKPYIWPLGKILI